MSLRNLVSQFSRFRPVYNTNIIRNYSIMTKSTPSAALPSSNTEWDPQLELPVEIKELINKANKKSSYSYILAFQQIINLLKTQKRTGWLNHDINACESIADHMYRMSLIAMSLNQENLQKETNEKVDLAKCSQIALVHDLAEALVGDIVPHDQNVDKIEKGKREYKTILYLADIIRPYNAKFSEEMCDLWLDYELQRNFNANIVKDIDKYELLISAFQYEQQYKGEKNLEEFFSARKMIKTTEIGKMADEIMLERADFWSQYK